MTATQSDNEQTLTRRGVLKTTAVGVGSAATIGTLGVGSAAAIAPVVALGYAGAVGLGYLMFRNAEKATGEKKDYSGYTGLEALKTGIYEDALEAKSTDERVMTSIRNNIQSSQNVAIAKGKAALVTKLNEGATESEANTAMTNAVNEYYATIQKNILTHLRAQRDKLRDMVGSLEAHPDTSGQVPTIKLYNKDNTPGYKGVNGFNGHTADEYAGTDSISLVNGESVDFSYIDIVHSAVTTEFRWKPTVTVNSEPKEILKFQSPEGNTTVYGFDRVVNAFEDCVSRRDEVNSQLVGLASDLYNNYEPGEIPTEEVLDPVTAATELGNNTGLSVREAQAGMMGIPTSAGFSLRLELRDGSGGTYEVDAEIYTNAQPNDSDGNPAGFKVGNTYDPDNFEAPIFVSYEYVDPETGERSTDFTEIIEPFTVLEATDQEGNEVTEVTPTSRTAQTADISSIEEELASIREEQQRLLEKSQSPGGAGAGWFGGGSVNVGAIAAVVGAAGVVYALATGGGS